MRTARWLVLVALPMASAHAADVTFTDVSGSAGVARATESYGASVADINGDGFPDIWVSNHRTRPSLYINQGNGTFFDAAAEVATWQNQPFRDTHGGSFADIDNDGDLDMLVTTGQGNDQQLLISDNGVFRNRTREYDIATNWAGGRLAVWHDFNGDRLIDVSVAQYAGVSRMYTNRGDHFSDDTSTLGAICSRHHYGHLIDLDHDRHLEFMCSGERTFPLGVFATSGIPWQNLSGRFPSVSHVADSITGDFNNDGLTDVFLLSGVQSRPSGAAQYGQHQVEFRTQGGEKGISFLSDGDVTVDLDWNLVKRNDYLTRIFIGAGGRHPSGVPFSLSSVDPANHGMPPRAPDIETPAILIGFDPGTGRWTFISQTGNKWSDAYLMVTASAAVSSLEVTGLWGTDKPARPTLLLANGQGWGDATQAAGLTSPILCASVTTGDFNNDMHLDLYIACRDGASNLPNVLYFGGPGGTFRRASASAGASGPVGVAIGDGAGTADSTVAADFDLDGFLDLFVTNGFNMRPKFVGGPGTLLHNNGNSNHWIMLDLKGTSSAGDAVGARITAVAGGVTQTRINGVGYHRWTQEHSRVHFGMGEAATADIGIDWPSGAHDFYEDVAVNHIYRAVEGGPLEILNAGGAGSPSCGKPSYNPEARSAVYIWRDCTGNGWGIRAAAGGGGATFSGALRSDVAYNSVSPFSLESNDVLNTSDPRNAVFVFNVWKQWQDGADFVVPDSPDKCFITDGDVFFGPEMTPVPSSFNPQTLRAC